jgi:hypothetical protein
MLIIDMGADRLPGEVKQNNLSPECGQRIEMGEVVVVCN